MTLLVVDVGNNETSIGLFDGDDLFADYIVGSDERRTSDEWFVLLEGLLRDASVESISGVAMSCTVPSIATQLRRCHDRYFADVPVWVVGPGVKTGVPIHTDNPKEVGADRVVNAMAAIHLYGGPAIVVDLNPTATVFDVIDARGHYVGGSIAPGVELSLEALSRRGAQLRSVELAEPANVIGKNTVEAIQSGAVFGFAGLVDGIVGRMLDELNAGGVETADVTVVATGTCADLIAELCRTVTAQNTYLTLQGLRLVAARNR